jgi:hypothetical protein
MHRSLKACLLQLGLLVQVGLGAVPPAPPAASITLLADMPKGTAVGGRDDGLSVSIAGFNCFLFGDTMLTASNSVGDYWVVNTMYHTTDTNADDGLVPGFNFTASGQPPLQFVPYTAAEQAYKEAHKSTDGYIYGIWPNGQFYSPYDSKHYITFDKVIERPSLLWIEIGSGLAVLPTDPINNTATRVQSRPGNAEDYLMWDSSERDWGHMCAVREDYVYFYHVEGQNFGALRVARAYLQDGPDAGTKLDFLEKTNWQYWSGSGWATNSPSSAAVLFYGAGVGTIDWNAYLPNGEGGNGCYLFTYLSWVSTNICVRASTDLIHWSAERIIATVPNIPSGSFPYFGRAHYGLEKERGRIIYISYCRPAQGFTQDIPMIRAEFPRPSLRAQLTPTNTLLLTWPAAFGSGFVLQQNSDPATANWSTNNGPVSQNNGTNQIVVLPLSARQFYRLVLP